MKRLSTALLALSLFAALVSTSVGQQPAAPLASPPAKVAGAEFIRLVDEVLADVSRLTGLELKQPLQKSVRTRQEIRDYLLRKMAEDDEPAKRYADKKVLEKFGLIPKGFDLDAFLVELLTEQIAGLYDPKAKEFYIADWNEAGDQRAVIAHELTHALHDQHFQIEAWVEAAKPNDDAEFAREAVLEGAALAVMLDYELAARNVQLRNLPDVGPLMEQLVLGDTGKNPQLAKAPPFVREALVFPYLAGTVFTQAVLKTVPDWPGFNVVFQKPPTSTQQIMHPELYLSGYVPQPVSFPDFQSAIPAEWKKLDENLVGEFGLYGVLKQFLGQQRARGLARAWDGDRYAIYEHEKTKQTLLLYRLRLAGLGAPARFFGQYSEALELKYEKRTDLMRRPNFFSFQTDEGGVFLFCPAGECVVVEGTTRDVFDRIVAALGWPAAPAPAAQKPIRTVARVTFPVTPDTVPRVTLAP